MHDNTVHIVETGSAFETEEAASLIGLALIDPQRPGTNLPILLHGPLGAGKTCFVRGLAKGLGSSSMPKSPTFALHMFHKGTRGLHHLDLYRLSGGKELEELGLEELFNGPDVVAVEWAERLSGYEPAIALHVEIDVYGENRRRIRMRGPKEWISFLLAAGNEEAKRARPGN